MGSSIKQLDLPSLDSLMEAMPARWRYRWCKPAQSGCGCLGCANFSGQVAIHGYTEAEWQQWKESHARTAPQEPAE